MCHHTQLKRNPKFCLETITRELKYTICSCLAHLRMHVHVTCFVLFFFWCWACNPGNYTFHWPSCPTLKEFPETVTMCLVLDLHLLCSLLSKQYLSSIIHTFLVALILSAQCVPFHFTTYSLFLWTFGSLLYILHGYIQIDIILCKHLWLWLPFRHILIIKSLCHSIHLSNTEYFPVWLFTRWQPAIH